MDKCIDCFYEGETAPLKGLAKMIEHVAAVVVAGGRGTRISGAEHSLPKQYLDLCGTPILTRTVAAFLSHEAIRSVVVVRHKDDENSYNHAISTLPENLAKRLMPAAIGGRSRQESAFAGLVALEPLNPDFVLIHDAARPFVTQDVISSVIDILKEGPISVLPAVPVFDTLKRHDMDTGTLKTVDRDNLWAAQTPQGFRYEEILHAHRKAKASSADGFTDDTAIAEWDGYAVALADGNPDNFKITTANDLERARHRIPMSNSSEPFDCEQNVAPLQNLNDIRFGTGYDVHAFEQGDAIILGGVTIPHNKKLKGHSDADVVLHAITDAILGAISEGDIGSHFPPSDPQWKGASSDQFLTYAINKVTEQGGKLAHLDVTLICEAPKIGPHRETMRTSIARICNLALARVSVKATTSEKLGFTGRKEGIACMAAATVRLPFSEGDTQ